MPRYATLLTAIAVGLTIIGSLILAGVVLSRVNHPNNWSFGEVIGYPGALIGGGLAVALIALVIARVRPPGKGQSGR